MKCFKYISYIVSLLVIVSVGIVIDNGRAIAANYPQIISVTPGNQEDGISTATTIQIVFDKSMSTDLDFELFDKYRNDVEGVIAWSNTSGNPNDTLTFTPSKPLKHGRVYHFKLWGFGVWDATETYCLGGGCTNRKFSFQTVAAPGDITSPTVRTIRPYDGNTGMGLRSSVRVYFSESMDKDSFIGSTNVTLTGGGITSDDYTVQYDFDGGILGRVPALRINLNKNLNTLTVYTVTIGSSVTDITGNPLGTPFTSTFKTKTADTTSPTAGTIPVHNDINVSLSPVIVVRFSEGVRGGTLNTSNITLQNLNDFTHVPLVVSTRINNIGDRSYVILAPEFGITTLDYNTAYRISVSGVKDSEGNSIVPFASDFTTIADASTNADPVLLGGDAKGITGSSFVDLCILAHDFDGDSGLAPADTTLSVTTSSPKAWTLLQGTPGDDVEYCYESPGDEGLSPGKKNISFDISDSAANTLSFAWPIRIFPAIPILLTSPADGAAGLTTTPNFTWNITGLTSMSDRTFIVVRDKPESYPESQIVWAASQINDGSTAHSVAIPNDLALDNCTTYYWYAGVVDHHIRPRGSAYSSERSFTTGLCEDDLIIDFGDPYGIWSRYNNATWAKLHSTSPEGMVAGDIDGSGQDDVIIDFGADTGIWVWKNNSTWTKLHAASPEGMVAGDIDGSGQDDVIIDFGADTGIWVQYNDTAWSKLHNSACESMTAGEIDGN
jgi:hypothetical protein